MHLVEPRGRRESDVGLAMRPRLVARLDDGVAEIVQEFALPLIRLHRGLDLIDRPAGNFASFLVTALDYALFQPRHALRRPRPLHVVVIAVREENCIVDVAVTVGPEWIVVPVIPWPQREVEEIAVSERPEPRTDPA